MIRVHEGQAQGDEFLNPARLQGIQTVSSIGINSRNGRDGTNSPLRREGQSTPRTRMSPCASGGGAEPNNTSQERPSSSWFTGSRPEPLLLLVCLLIGLGTLVVNLWPSTIRIEKGSTVVEHQHTPVLDAHHGSHVLKCSSEQAALQAEEFRGHSVIESACAEHLWMEGFQAMNPSGHKVLLDIGCNLGYQSVEFFDRFIPELGISKWSLYSSMEGDTVAARCNVCDTQYGDPGACTATHMTPLLPAGMARSVEVHCFEPGDLHYPRLVKNRETMFGASKGPRTTPRKAVGASQGWWHLHNVAVSNYSGVAPFSKGCINGKCSLQDRTSGDYIVQVTTVDEFVAAQRLRHVDIMKIDTEGFDPLVLRGALQLLERHAVTVFLFEYHKINMWTTTLLGDLVTWLDDLGYVCYFEGTPLLYKLSRGCWDERYEIKEWSNVVCGLAGGAVERLLDARTFLRVLRKGMMPKDDKSKTAAPSHTTAEEYSM